MNLKSKIKKVSELAERGIDGEKENAKAKLIELQEKYKTTHKQIKKQRTFKLANFEDCKDIMAHCILDVDIDAQIEGSKQKKELYCNLTKEQYDKVCENFNWYYPSYVTMKDYLLKGFVLSKKLGVNSNQIDTESEINSIIKYIHNELLSHRK